MLRKDKNNAEKMIKSLETKIIKIFSLKEEFPAKDCDAYLTSTFGDYMTLLHMEDMTKYLNKANRKA